MLTFRGDRDLTMRKLLTPVTGVKDTYDFFRDVGDDNRITAACMAGCTGFCQIVIYGGTGTLVAQGLYILQDKF